MTLESQSEDDVVLEFGADGAQALGSGEYRDMEWKGFGGDSVPAADGFEGPVVVGSNGSVAEDGLDMTPMVDVTFLLLIFFMVTASFVVQKSIAQPPRQASQPSTDVVDSEDIVTVTIDSNNTYYVTSRDEGEVECPSRRELFSRVQAARKMSDVDRMTILAHVDSMHKKVISAWDAGVVAGIEKISIETTEEEL